MSTTALFAELLIVGIQGSIWLMMLVIVAFGHSWIPQVAATAKDWSGMLLAIYIAVAYSWGVVLDRVVDATLRLTRLHDRLLHNRWLTNKAKTLLADNRVAVYGVAGTLAAYQQYILGRARIARSTFFNTTLVALVGLILAFMRSGSFAAATRTKLIAAAIVFAIVFVPLTMIAYVILEKTLEIRSRQIQEWLAVQSGSPARERGREA